METGAFLFFQEVALTMISEWIKAEIEQAVRAAAAQMQCRLPEGFTVLIEQPANPGHGDYSSNAAMQLAKIFRRPPLLIAGMIREELESAGLAEGLVKRVDTAAPGFLNLYIDWSVWARREFVPLPAERGKVLIEHTSVNPNKSMHIGHLRNSCIGDTLARMLKRTGADARACPAVKSPLARSAIIFFVSTSAPRSSLTSVRPWRFPAIRAFI